MEFLDVFAIVILSVLGLTLVGVWVLLGMMPGRIARGRTTRKPTPSASVDGGASSPWGCCYR